MAVLGRVLVSSAERVDLADFLSIDSYTAGDFKFLLKGIVGEDKPFILKGFDIIDPQNAIGTQNCSIRVADSIVFYPGSSAGPFYCGLEEGNVNAQPLVPELRKNAVNYIYLTFSTFNTSDDTRAFWDPDRDGGAGSEFTQDVNTETALRCDVNVSVGSFPENVIPIAKVTVGPVVITAIEDARDLLCRLGTGGVSPNPLNTWNWRSSPSAGYERSEPPTTMIAGGVNPFQGGDKNLYSLKEWMDAVMSKLKELGGSTYWYQDTSTFNLVTLFGDALARTLKSKGQWTHDSSTAGLVTWTEDLQLKSLYDPRTYIIRNGSKTLAEAEVGYLSLIRNQPINVDDTAVVWTNGANYVNTPNGAVGNFSNLAKGDWIKKIDDHEQYFLRVEEFYDSINLGGSVTIPASARSIRLSGNYAGISATDFARYDKGEYLPADITVSQKSDIAIDAVGGNYYWLISRSDTIESVGNIESTSLTIDISENDSATARVDSTVPHNLVDGDYITISGSTNFDGTYKVDVVDADTFYIQINTGPWPDESSVTATYAVATTVARSTAYGYQLESANHGFSSDDTIIISGTTNYNGTPKINKRDAENFNFAIDAAYATETSGFATLARIITRGEQGMYYLIQGENADISASLIGNIKQFLGMTSDSQTYPDYAISPSYNTLDGMANYNSLSSDNVTTRLSNLTAMMADKAQDKTVQFATQNLTTVTNTTNGAAQEITFDPAGSTLTLILPGSPGNAVVSLPNSAPGISLLGNQVAYVQIDRNAASTPSIQISDTDSLEIDENTFIIASRITGSNIYLWDSNRYDTGATPLDPTFNSQDRNLKLVKGGTWSWDSGTNTLDWDSDAYIQVPGLTEVRNTILAASNTALTADGMCLYVDINRLAGGASNLTVSAASISSVPTTSNIVIIARRTGSSVVLGNNSMLLVDGESKSLYAGLSDQNSSFIGISSEATETPSYGTEVSHTPRFITEGSSLYTSIARLDEQLDKLFGQLRLVQKSPASTRVIVTGAEQILLDNTTISQQIQNLLLDFDGAEIDFDSGMVYESDGVTPLGVDFTPATITAGQYHWYAVSLIPNAATANNKISAQLTIVSAVGDGATADLAPRAGFSSGIRLGQVVVQESGGSIANITQANIIQLGIGSGNGSDAEGDGDALVPINGYGYVIRDDFTDGSSSQDYKVNATLTKASYSIVNDAYRISCDKTKTVNTSSGTSFTINSAPSFTVAAGDIVYVTSGLRSGQWRKIASISSQTDYTLDAAFTGGDASNGDTLMVSQAVWTKDLVNFGSATEKTRARDFFSGDITQIALLYEDSIDVGDNIPNFVDPAAIVASASNEGLVTDVTIPTSDTFTTPYVRPQAPDQIDDYILLTNANQERLSIVFFCNPDNGSVTDGANLLKYDANFFYDTQLLTNAGLLDSAIAFSDSSTTPINCTVDNSGPTTKIVLDWSFAAGLRPGEPVGQLEVYVDGLSISRYVSGATTPVTDLYYTEEVDVAGDYRIVNFNSDLSGLPREIVIKRRQGVIDESSTNTNKLTYLFDVIVGTPAQLAIGAATHSNLQDAIDLLVSQGGGKCMILTGTITGNLNSSGNNITIEGKGRSSIIDGTITMSGDGNLIKGIRANDDVFISGDNNHIDQSWVVSGKTLSNTGSGNQISYVQE